MDIKKIEAYMDSYEQRIAQFDFLSKTALDRKEALKAEYKEFKLKNPHPNNKGGSGAYGAWTFEDTLEEVKAVQEQNNQ